MRQCPSFRLSHSHLRNHSIDIIARCVYSLLRLSSLSNAACHYSYQIPKVSSTSEISTRRSDQNVQPLTPEQELRDKNTHMGSLCGKPSVEDTSSSAPGRTIGSTQAHIPSNDNRAPIPARAGKPSVKVGGPGRTVGGVARDGEAVVVVEDPRAAAARAAEV